MNGAEIPPLLKVERTLSKTMAGILAARSRAACQGHNDRSFMRKHIMRIALLSLLFSLCFAGQSALAQSHTDADVNFGTFHGVNGGPSQYDDVLWSQLSPTPAPGDYSASSGNCINTSIGYLCAPQSINNITGHATYVLQFTLSPNGHKGSINGSFNVNYEGGAPPWEPLELTVNYSAASD
jgi:hypothetical protein